ncbi:MAG TPA: hypothetical protein VGE43_03205, partial [Acidimicrobiales bacterium]
ARENLEITSSTMDFLVPQTEEGWAHRRDVLERAIVDPAARAEIDSGRLYAPHRYGADPHPAVGALLPDHAVEGVRLRELARRGLLLLSREPVAVPHLDVPCSAVTVSADAADGLGLRADEVWVVRPDAHVGAVVGRDGVAGAVRGLLG